MLRNRPATALIVIDVQVGVVEAAHARDAVVATIASLVDTARSRSIPVIWVQHENEQLVRGADAWKIVPELEPRAGDPVIYKRWGDAFEETSLEAVLGGLGVGKLWIAGAQTDACIRSTLHGAMVRGYDTVLVADAHTTEDLSTWGAPPPDQVIRHTNLYWAHQTAPGRSAEVAKAASVVFEGAGREA